MQLAIQTVRNLSLSLFVLGSVALAAPILLAFSYAASVLASGLMFP
jgi:hypothetical protein